MNKKVQKLTIKDAQLEVPKIKNSSSSLTYIPLELFESTNTFAVFVNSTEMQDDGFLRIGVQNANVNGAAHVAISKRNSDKSFESALTIFLINQSFRSVLVPIKKGTYFGVQVPLINKLPNDFEVNSENSEFRISAVFLKI